MEAFKDYLDKIKDENQKARTEEVLAWVSNRYPSLERKIAWNQPMFIDHGTFIIAFSVAKQHLAFALEEPAAIKFKEEIAKSGYEQTIKFVRMKWNQPVDYDLLERIISFIIEDKAQSKTFWIK